MKYTAPLFALMLAGCVSVPVTPDFPPALKELTEACPELKKIEGDNVLMTDMLTVVAENYTAYYLCSLKNQAWNDWYKQQKKIYDGLKSNPTGQ